MLDRRALLSTVAAIVPYPVSARPAEASVARSEECLGRIGVALFTIPKLLDEDFAGGLKLLADIGTGRSSSLGLTRSAFRRPTSVGSRCRLRSA